MFPHAIELAIKDLADTLPRLWDEKHAIKLSHKLLDNWELIKPYLSRDPPFEATGSVPSVIEAVLTDLVALDPKGEAFRFPSARDGKLFLQDTSIVNLGVFAVAMATVTAAFDYWHQIAHEAWEASCEFDAAAPEPSL